MTNTYNYFHKLQETGDRLHHKLLSKLKSARNQPNKLSDIPTDDDRLGYDEFAEAITKKMLDAARDGGTPFTIGIHGEWGSGKTSFLKLIEKQLKKENIRPIWFNAWKYNQEDNLWSALLQKILDDAPLNYPILIRPFIRFRLLAENINITAGGLELIKKFLILIARIGLLIIGAGIALGFFSQQISAFALAISIYLPVNSQFTILAQAKALQWISGILIFIAADPKKVLDLFSGNLGLEIPKFSKNRSYKKHIAYLDEFNEEFRQTIKIVSGQKPLVVFIDDLDRCFPEKSLQTLEAIKLFLDVENCIFVVAVDRDVIEQAVSTRYAKEIGIDEKKIEQSGRKVDFYFLAQNYIEKIVQLPFTLPPLGKKVKDYVEFLYPEGISDGCGDIFSRGLPANPRKIKRAIQSFILLTHIASKRMEKEKAFKIGILAKLVIIESQYRLLHQDILREPALLEGIERFFRKQEELDLSKFAMPVHRNEYYQERIKGYISDLNLEQLFSLKDNNSSFIGADISDYLFLLKTVSETTPITSDIESISQGAAPLVVANEDLTKEKYQEMLKRYLEIFIASYQDVNLKGIRIVNRPISIQIEKVFMPPKCSIVDRGKSESDVPVLNCLAKNQFLLIKGDPGCGKTALLTYIGLTYARSFSTSGSDVVKSRLGVEEHGYLPILVSLKELGDYLTREHSDAIQDSVVFLLSYLIAYYKSQNIFLVNRFFENHFESGKVALLLDGLDEIVDISLKQRIVNLIEQFVIRYPSCRVLITSRNIGLLTISVNFTVLDIHLFQDDDKNRYLSSLYSAIQNESIPRNAKEKNTTINSISPSRVNSSYEVIEDTQYDISNLRNKLLSPDDDLVEDEYLGYSYDNIVEVNNNQGLENFLEIVEKDEYIYPLTCNPLFLTVVFFYNHLITKLPAKRSFLLHEILETILWDWDSGKGLNVNAFLDNELLFNKDTIYKILARAAYELLHSNSDGLENGDIKTIISDIAGDQMTIGVRDINSYLEYIGRSGLLLKNDGVYSFQYPIFQEYLTAKELSTRDVLGIVNFRDRWERVTLFEAGILARQSMKQAGDLIHSLLFDQKKEKDKDTLIQIRLARSCIFDEIGIEEIEKNQAELLKKIRDHLNEMIETLQKKNDKESRYTQITVCEFLSSIEENTQGLNKFWNRPYGEPHWITIPAGEFWMGDEPNQHKIFLPEYQIAPIPITNSQYALYVKYATVPPPDYWYGLTPPRGLENHPVVNISWEDALSYCNWLGEKLNKHVSLPSEAEWEKAARGNIEPRSYPWGDTWKELHCNSDEFGLLTTSPVDVFADGISPFGLFDMSGNVWEWTRTIYDPKFSYPYNANDGREDLKSKQWRMLRGGSFRHNLSGARCTSHNYAEPLIINSSYGFRPIVRPDETTFADMDDYLALVNRYWQESDPHKRENILLEIGMWMQFNGIIESGEREKLMLLLRANGSADDLLNMMKKDDTGFWAFLKNHKNQLQLGIKATDLLLKLAELFLKFKTPTP